MHIMMYTYTQNILTLYLPVCVKSDYVSQKPPQDTGIGMPSSDVFDGNNSPLAKSFLPTPT